MYPTPSTQPQTPNSQLYDDVLVPPAREDNGDVVWELCGMLSRETDLSRDGLAKVAGDRSDAG